MPELPEVQTVVSDLQKITGDTVTGFWSDWEKSLPSLSAEILMQRIKNTRILSIRRLSKFIVLDLSSKDSLLFHLRMTGKLLITKRKTLNATDELPRHLHHILFLKKNGALEFHDIRKFGKIILLPTNEVVAENFNLGIDPLSTHFTKEIFKKIIAKRPNRPLKLLLLDQDLIAGIGNIYASEILFASKILPDRKGASLSETELSHLHTNIRRILSLAIKLRGTSISDYRDSHNKSGSFQKVLRVYKRHGQACSKCGTIVKKSVIGQRSTFFCPTCQG